MADKMASEEPIEATDLQQVVLHLRYLRKDVQHIGQKVEELSDDMATRAELEAVRAELNEKLDALKAEIDANTASSTASRVLGMVTKVGTAMASLVAFGAAIAAFVHFIDRVPTK
jgi:hypothetical protein